MTCDGSVIIWQYSSWSLHNAIKFFAELDASVTVKKSFISEKSLANGCAEFYSSFADGTTQMNANEEGLEVRYIPRNLSEEKKARVRELAEKYFGQLDGGLTVM